MAEMIPTECHPDTASYAEKTLFPIFQKGLDSTFIVFHGAALQAVNTAQGGVNDREIDFLIAHPQHGLLALEVKGGQIRVERGQWRQNGNPMRKTPIKQVKQATYDLHAHLKKAPQTKSFHYPLWYGVAFPDVDVEGDLGTDAPRVIILDKRDCRSDALQETLVAIYQHYVKTEDTSPGEAGIAALVSLLAPSYTLRSLLTKDFEDEAARIKVLTEEQYEVLEEHLAKNTNYLITGVAGSGKTMLAMEHASRLAKAGKRVLFTCFNRALMEWLRHTYPSEAAIQITNFHDLCATFPPKYGIPVPNHSEAMEKAGISQQDYFQGILPQKLSDAAEKMPDADRFDAILVDEGQDFRQTYWTPLMMLLKDRSASHFYIFCDDSQTLYGRHTFPFEAPTYHLKKNLRNTRPIGERVGKFHRGKGDYRAAGPDSVNVVQIREGKDQRALLADALATLKREQIPAHHIVLLTPLRGQSQWKEGETVGGFTLRWRGAEGLPTAEGVETISVQTIQSFKGLERPVVIVSELRRAIHMYKEPETYENLVYVALSRAKHYLIVIGGLPAWTNNPPL
ncbi:MAG TPA: NERD domain-containing protein [Aggregatilineales bacterium]|nr:NERD domain-containing protein [Anaerolineales bacterium]HRE46764.1 NERD domain-containing protein [Aggregatilineales bacterium]